jgi:hypothetical protein
MINIPRSRSSRDLAGMNFRLSPVERSISLGPRSMIRSGNSLRFTPA